MVPAPSEQDSESNVALHQQPPSKKRRGLNPLLMFTNRMLASARQNAGRSLTMDEVAMLRKEARAKWDELPDKSAQEQLFAMWQEAPPTTASEPVLPPYKALWGGGCRAAPVSASELCAHYRRYGWPSDQEVHKDKSAYVSASEEEWGALKSYDCFGCLRAAVNICKEDAARSRAFQLIHGGLTNYLESLPRHDSESGTILLVLEGRLKGSAPSPLRRWAYIVTGTCWSPRVFEATLNDFADASQACSEDLALPCDIRLAERKSKVSDRYTCLDDRTSAEIAVELTSLCAEVVLFKADYSILLGRGTLLWSRIKHLHRVGALLGPAVRAPLLADELAAKRRGDRTNPRAGNLRKGDPLGPSVAQGLSRGRHRSSEAPHTRARQRGQGVVGKPLGAALVQAGGESSIGQPGGVAAASSANPALPSSGVVGDPGAPALGNFPNADYDEGCDLEAELANMVSSDEEELWASFGAPADLANNAPQVDEDALEPQASVRGMLQDIASEAVAQANALGLDGGGASAASPVEGAASGEHAGAGDAEDFLPPPPPADPMARYGCTGPSAMGYFHKDGRSVMRVLRGQPRGSLSVRCYRHPRCTFLLPLRMAPPDAELVSWLFEVPTAEEGGIAGDVTNLGKKHSDLSKRWRQQAAVGKASAASSG